MLRKYAEKNPDASKMLIKKAEAREAQYNHLLDVSNYKKVLDHVDMILNKVEEELAKHREGKRFLGLMLFTCTDFFRKSRLVAVLKKVYFS